MSNKEICGVMHLQPIINIGMIGHVSNGKSSITKALTGISTQKHSLEKQGNKTIKLGYANAKIYKCAKCPEPECYQPGPSETFNRECKLCNANMELVTHISIVDCPGHIKLMSTMISGTNIMDTTVLVEAINNEVVPAPQTTEHINAITVGNIPNSIICLNKWDLVKNDQGLKKSKMLADGLRGTPAEGSPMVPVSATFDINIDVLCYYISQLPVPIRDLSSPAKMIVVRSFNVNKPGISIDDLCGGVIGGSILHGKIEVGMDIELLPGYPTENKDDGALHKSRWKYTPLRSKVVSIHSGNNDLKYAIPGGLIGVQLDIDPALTANDKLIGQILTPVGKGATVFEDIKLQYNQLDSKLSVKKGDALQLNINACSVSCQIKKIYSTGDQLLKLKLSKPTSVNIGDKVTITYNERIFGMGRVIGGTLSTHDCDN
jgi:translation initiation factor 2 subunit 3